MHYIHINDMSVFITQIVLTLYDCVTGNIASKLAAAYMYL